jgi:3-oxoacyl-[acyl-carrier protein] reductase
MGIYKGRKILITGASTGLGAGLLNWLSREGADVIGVARNFKMPERAGIELIELDLSDPQNVRKLIDHSLNYQPDTVIHALGGGFKVSSDFIQAEDFWYILNLNFIISLQLNNAILPKMIERRRGWVVHIGSIATKEVTASVGYTCVKSLIAPYVKHLGRKLLQHNVFLSGVSLGAITGYDGAMDRLQNSKNEVYSNFIHSRRPTKRSTPVAELTPYFNLLLTETANIHASNMMTLDEGESNIILG